MTFHIKSEICPLSSDVCFVGEDIIFPQEIRNVNFVMKIMAVQVMNKRNLPKRKQNRFPEYDYSKTGCYFITICTKNRAKILSKIVGADIIRPCKIELSDYGKIVDDAIKNISNIYDNISIPKYVIMPDHIHLIIKIRDDKNGRMISAPTVVAGMKRYVSKKCGFPMWQKGFYDHIIRNQADYNETYEYIENNPLKWVLKNNGNGI